LKIEGAYLKCKNQKRLTFRPRCIHTGQKTGPKISCDSPFKLSVVGWVDIGTGAKGRRRKIDPYKLKILKLVSYLFMASCQNH